MKYIVLFGPPGAGKGTQAVNMAKNHNLCHISTGQLLREEIGAGTELGKQAKALIDDGNLVPDDVVQAMIEGQFKQKKTCEGFILDGFPRTIAQANALEDILSKLSSKISAVISIMIPDSEIMTRIKHRASIEGRADDTSEEIINNRIETYHQKTQPIIDFYKEKGNYIEVDGLGSIEEVEKKISAIMETL